MIEKIMVKKVDAYLEKFVTVSHSCPFRKTAKSHRSVVLSFGRTEEERQPTETEGEQHHR